MKKVWKLILIVLLIAVVAAAALAWQYRDYLQAFSASRQYSSEDLRQQMEDNEAALEDILSEYLPETLLEEPQEEIPQSISPEQVMPTPQNESPSIAQEEKPTEPKDPEIAVIMNEFYQLRDEYGNKLEDIQNRAYAEYRQSGSDKSKFAKMVIGYVREATLLEVECDKKVFALADRLEKHIEANGGDQTLPDKILELYFSEKRVKKAWYFSELEKRGLKL